MDFQFQRYAKVSDIPGVSINDSPYDRTVKLLSSPLIARQNIHFAVGISIIEFDKIHETHQHDVEEVIFILSGRGEITINHSERVPLEPETIVILRPNEPHGIKVLGNESLSCLWIYAPPGPEAKFVSGAGCLLSMAD